MGGCSERMRSAAHNPSSVLSGGIRTSMTATSGLCPGLAEQILGVPGLGHDITAPLLEEPGGPFSQQHGVVRDDDAQGSAHHRRTTA